MPPASRGPSRQGSVRSLSRRSVPASLQVDVWFLYDYWSTSLKVDVLVVFGRSIDNMVGPPTYIITVYSGYSGHSDIVATFLGTKKHLFYYIQVGYSGQSDIVARKWWPKVATISEVHCIGLYLLYRPTHEMGM